MKNLQFILFFGIILSFFSCEVDDICLEPTTPQLIIRFYDIANPTNKKIVNSLNIWVVGKDSIVKNEKIDSIAIPLKTGADITTYKFSSSNLVDEITFTYERNEVFVSRSCGYKFVFNNMNASNSSSNWIQQMTIIKPTVENEKNAHIKIMH